MDTPTGSGAIIICSSLDRFLDHCQRYDVTTVGVDGRVTQGVVLSFTTNLWSDITLTAFGRIDCTLVALGARIPVENVWCEWAEQAWPINVFGGDDHADHAPARR